MANDIIRVKDAMTQNNNGTGTGQRSAQSHEGFSNSRAVVSVERN